MISTVIGTALLASVSLAMPSNTKTSSDNNGIDGPQELTDLIEQAKANVLRELAENEAKLRKRGITPSCTLSKLVFRRE